MARKVSTAGGMGKPMNIRKRGGGSFNISGANAAKHRAAFFMKLSAQGLYKQGATKADTPASTKLLTQTRAQRKQRGLAANRKRAETQRNSWVEAQGKGGFSVKASNTGVKTGKNRKAGGDVQSRLKSNFAGKQAMKSNPRVTEGALSQKSKAFKSDVKKAGVIAKDIAAAKKLKGVAKSAFVKKQTGPAGVSRAASVAAKAGRGGSVAQKTPPKLLAARAGKLKGAAKKSYVKKNK